MWRILFAIVLIAHGIGHTMGFMAAWTAVPMGFNTGHWLFSPGVTINSVAGKACGLLWLVAMIGSVGAGFGVLLQQEWWKPLAIAAAVVSLVAVVPWLNVMPPGSALGAVAVDVLLLVLLLFPWGERFLEELR